MSDPRRNPSSSRRTSTTSSSRAEASSAFSTTPAGDAPRTHASFQQHIRPPSSSPPERVLSAPASSSSSRRLQHPPDWSQRRQQQQQSASSTTPLDGLANVAILAERVSLPSTERREDRQPEPVYYQQNVPRSTTLESPSSVRAQTGAYAHVDFSPSQRRSSREFSESPPSSPGRSPSDRWSPALIQPGAVSDARSIPSPRGPMSAQSLHSPTVYESFDQRSASTRSAHSGPPTSTSSGSPGSGLHRTFAGRPSSPAPPPPSSETTLREYELDAQGDVEMGGGDVQESHTSGGAMLSVKLPTSNARGGRSGNSSRSATGGRIVSLTERPLPDFRSRPPQTPERRFSQPTSEAGGIDPSYGYNTPNLATNILDSPAFLQDNILTRQSGDVYSQYARQQEQFAPRQYQFSATPTTARADEHIPATPPPPSPSEHGYGHLLTNEASGARRPPGRPQRLSGPGVPRSPLGPSPTAARPQSLQESRMYRRDDGLSPYRGPQSEMPLMAGRSVSARSGAPRSAYPESPLTELVSPQAVYPLHPQQIEFEPPSSHAPARQSGGIGEQFPTTRAIAAIAIEAQARTGSAARSSSSNLRIPSDDDEPGTSQRTSPKRHKAGPKDEDEFLGKDSKSRKGKGDSPRRKPRTSAGRKKSGENVRGPSYSSGSPAQQQVDRQFQQLSIEIPQSQGAPSQGIPFRSPAPGLSPSQFKQSPGSSVGPISANIFPSPATPGEPSSSKSAARRASKEKRQEDGDAMDEDTDGDDSPLAKRSKSKGKGKGPADWDGDDKDYEFNVGDTPPGEEREKREKISIACSFCRTRKIKCDGVRPRCGRCMTRNDGGACEYAAEPKRRGRGKKTKEREAREIAAKERAKAARPKKDLKKNSPAASSSTDALADLASPANLTAPMSMSASTSSTAPALTIRVPPALEGQFSSSSSSVGPSSSSAPPSAGPGPTSRAHRLRSDRVLPPIQTIHHLDDPAVYALSLPMPAPAPSPVTSLPPISDITAYADNRPPSAAQASSRHTPIPALSPLEAPGAPAWLRAPDEQFDFNVRHLSATPSFSGPIHGGVARSTSRSSVGPSRSTAAAIVNRDERIAGSKRSDDDEENAEFSSSDGDGEYVGSDKRLKKRRKKQQASASASRRQSDRDPLNRPPRPPPSPPPPRLHP